MSESKKKKFIEMNRYAFDAVLWNVFINDIVWSIGNKCNVRVIFKHLSNIPQYDLKISECIMYNCVIKPSRSLLIFNDIIYVDGLSWSVWFRNIFQWIEAKNILVSFDLYPYIVILLSGVNLNSRLLSLNSYKSLLWTYLMWNVDSGD